MGINTSITKENSTMATPRKFLFLITRAPRSEEHTSELQSPCNLVCRLRLAKKKRDAPDRPREQSGSESTGHRPPTAARLHSKSAPRWIGRRLQPPTFAGRCPLLFNDTAATGIYPLSLHDALPI